MPKQTPIEGLIPNLYKKSALHTAIFFWINGQRDAFPNGISIEVSIEKFYKFCGISEEDLPMKTAKAVYTRMQNDLIEKFKDDARKST